MPSDRTRPEVSPVALPTETGSPEPPFRFLEFFAGAGLARLGLEPEWRCAWANDNDPRKAAAYAANFGSGELRLSDVDEVQADELPSGAQLAWASFPCQDLSLAGGRRGLSGGKSGAFWPCWRLLRELRLRDALPPLVVLENVPGLLCGGDFPTLCRALGALPLQFGALVVDARRFLPQSRPRVFLVGLDARVDCRGFVQQGPEGSPWFPRPCVRAWEGLPPRLRRHWRWWRLPVPTAVPRPVAAMLELGRPEVPWSPARETERLLGLMDRANRAKVREPERRGRTSVGFLYRRTRGGTQRGEVRFDGLAGCLRAPGGGSSRQTLLLVEEGRIRSRLLTPREAARLMGVPDTFVLPRSDGDAYRALGEGVAVPAVARLATHLLTPLARHTAAPRLADKCRGRAPRSWSLWDRQTTCETRTNCGQGLPPIGPRFPPRGPVHTG